MVLSLVVLFWYTKIGLHLKDTAGLNNVTCARCPDPDGGKALGAAPGQDRRGRPPVPVWPSRPLSGPYRRYPERPTGRSCGHHPVCRGRASRAPPRARLLLADLRWADVHLARRDLVVRRG